jgi:hypothetical protein
MMESGYYPPGVEFDPLAPWNEKEFPEEEIEVTVSVTLSKTVKIAVNDYTVDEDIDYDEEGSPHSYKTIDFSECNLKKAVEEQVILPQDAVKYVVPNPEYVKAFSGWVVDDFDVIKE